MSVSKVLYCIIFLTFFLATTSSGQTVGSSFFRYSFTLFDTPLQHQTIRQSINNIQSSYRVMAKKSHDSFSSLEDCVIQSAAAFAIIIPFSQAESQRAILTYNQIGSQYSPWSFALPETSVNKVSDQDLSSLKSKSFNQYIRLFSSTTESNYLWLNEMETMLFFQNEDFQNVKYDYFIRKMLCYGYHIFSLFPSFSEDISISNNQLDQRIASINVYSYVKNIFNDTLQFKRNVVYSDLSNSEKSYLTRVAYLSFLNLFSNFIIGAKGIQLSPNTEMAFSLSQLLSPLGEIYNQDFWFRNTNGLKAKVTFREIINDKSIFPGISLALYDLNLSNKIKFDWSANLWSQPEHLSFKDRSGSLGGASEIGLHYQTKPRKASNIKRIDFDLNALYKSQGFLPGILNLDESLILSAGLSINIL